MPCGNPCPDYTQTRVNLIAWLRSQGSGGYAVPAPDPARQPGAAPAGGEAETPEDAAVEAGTPTSGVGPQVPVTGAAGQSTIQESPVAPSAATSGTASPR